MLSNVYNWLIIPHRIITAYSTFNFKNAEREGKDERIKPGTHHAVQDEQQEKKSTWLSHPLDNPDTTVL